MSDWNPIALVPAIRRLTLCRVGCWEALEMEFLPGLNVITELGSARGKSTVLRSIREATGPAPGRRFPLTPTEGSEEGRVTLEFLYATISRRLVAPKMSPSRGENTLSMGQRMLAALRARLHDGHDGLGLLVDADVISPLDTPRYREALRLLNGAPCQVICVIGAGRFDVGDFPGARIFACRQGDTGKAGIVLMQAGTES